MKRIILMLVCGLVLSGCSRRYNSLLGVQQVFPDWKVTPTYTKYEYVVSNGSTNIFIVYCNGILSVYAYKAYNYEYVEVKVIQGTLPKGTVNEKQ